MRPKTITMQEIEYMAFSLAKRMMVWNEPIPDFGTRFPNILESCIKTPFFRFNNTDQYRGIVGKASIFFYLMIKNHPFQNGNKRIAVMSLFYFLSKNGKWLDISKESLYAFAVSIAKSKSKEEAIGEITDIIKNHLIDFPSN